MVHTAQLSSWQRIGQSGVSRAVFLTVGVLCLGHCDSREPPGEELPPASQHPDVTECELAFAPRCGEPCPCVCTCAGSYCEDDVIYDCDLNRECYEPRQTCAPGTCVSVSIPFCADTPDACPDIAQAYQSIVAGAGPDPTAEEPPAAGTVLGAPCSDRATIDDCGLTRGHCELGLGACWYLGLGRAQAELERLARLYEDLGCATPSPCECPEPKVDAECLMSADGGWWLDDAGSIRSTWACIIVEL